MRASFILFCLIIAISACSPTQKINHTGTHPHLSFVSLIVTEIDTAITWYSNILGFTLIDRVDNQERGFSQANLKSGEMKLELIETNTTLSQKQLLLNQPERARVAGFFKVGFSVHGFDKWVQKLSKAEVKFRGDVVVDQSTGKRMVIILDPDENRIQLFEHH